MRKFVLSLLSSAISLAVLPVHAATLVKIDGSSTVYPITEAVAEEFQKSTQGQVKVTVGISGTGGGFKKFCRDEIDIADASRPILEKEMADCRAAGIKYIELPVAFDALTIVTNPNNKFLSQLTVEELKKLWEPAAQGNIKTWNQINDKWPAQPITLYGPGSDSGTFDYFTEAVVGKAKSSRGDYTASEDDNVLVQGVSRDVHALGYFGYAYYIENKDKLKAVPIVAAPGKPAVLPSLDNVTNGSYQPLSRPIFIYINEKALNRPEVKQFADFYMKNAAALSAEVKYVPLTKEDYMHAQKNLDARKLGTAFGGHAEVGVRIADLLKREPKQ